MAGEGINLNLANGSHRLNMRSRDKCLEPPNISIVKLHEAAIFGRNDVTYIIFEPPVCPAAGRSFIEYYQGCHSYLTTLRQGQRFVQFDFTISDRSNISCSHHNLPSATTSAHYSKHLPQIIRLLGYSSNRS